MQELPSEHRIIRYKISHKMAFPVGYELLQREFGDLPQWPRFEFWFMDRPTYRASEFARTLAAREPYPIVSVRHRTSSPGFTIEVCPVTRALKSVARESFLICAREDFRPFILAEPASPNYRDLRAAFFDPVSHTCTVKASI